jgi:hypothetical protein
VNPEAGYAVAPVVFVALSYLEVTLIAPYWKVITSEVANPVKVVSNPPALLTMNVP